MIICLCFYLSWILSEVFLHFCTGSWFEYLFHHRYLLCVVYYPNMVKTEIVDTHTHTHTHADTHKNSQPQQHRFQSLAEQAVRSTPSCRLVTSQTGNRKQTKVSSLPASDRWWHSAYQIWITDVAQVGLLWPHFHTSSKSAPLLQQLCWPDSPQAPHKAKQNATNQAPEYFLQHVNQHTQHQTFEVIEKAISHEPIGPVW